MRVTRRQAFGIVIAASATPLAAASKPPEVTAAEDLMREHGVLRRILLIYREVAAPLRRGSAIDPASLHKAAELFRRFGEEYHEKKLEEEHIFPVVRKMRGRAATYPDILEAQHKRGREITSFILARTDGARVTEQEKLADVFDRFVRMYERHAAREDTIVFPAWKLNFTDQQLDQIGAQFEDIEKKTFGHDGFEDAEKSVSAIEGTLGLSDLRQFTAPEPKR